ncbi:MAG: carboxypeptidase regulatory-like domain-containing protein, partial [Bacteroidetes bacterium]|nr:carboxypeptidase regulatory-like domain-containing protein [Bacteroidota bacterium]
MKTKLTMKPQLLKITSLLILLSSVQSFSQAIIGTSNLFQIGNQIPEYSPIIETSNLFVLGNQANEYSQIMASSNVFEINSMGQYFTGYSNLFVLNTNCLQANCGSISGTITDINTGAIIPSANLILSSGIYGAIPVSTNTSGNYVLNTQFGYGYSLTIYANGYESKTIEAINLSSTNPNVFIDMQLLPYLGNLSVSSLSPYLNPTVSTVVQGGKLHRYYQLADPTTNQIGAGTEITVSVNSSDKTFLADENGMVDIEIESSEIGDGLPGAVDTFYIIKINQDYLQSPVNFICEVENPYSETHFAVGSSHEIGLGFWIIPTVTHKEFNQASEIFISNDANPIDFENVRYQNYKEGSYGLSIGTGFSFIIDNAGAQAGISQSSDFMKLSEQEYLFDANFNSNEALVRYVLFADGCFNELDQSFIRLLQISMNAYQNSIYSQIAENAMTKDFQGFCLENYGEAETSLNFPDAINYSNIVDFKFNASGGIKSKISAGRLPQSNEYIMEITGIYEINGNLGEVFSIPSTAAFDFFNSEYDFNSYCGFLNVKNKVIYNYFSDEFRYELSLEKRWLANGTGKQQVITFYNDNPVLLNAIKQSLDDLETIENSLKYGLSGILSLKHNFINDLIYYTFLEFYNNHSQVRYIKQNTIIDSYNLDEDILIDIGLPILISASFSDQTFSEKGKSYTLEEGFIIDGKLLPLKENDEPLFIDQNFESYFVDLIDAIPQNIKQNFGNQQNINLNSSKSSTWILDSLGSSIFFDSISLTFPVDSFSCTVWNWEGQMPGTKSKSLTNSEKKVLNTLKTQAFTSFGMDYGIGGFYQFEPYDTVFSDTAQLTIFYPDSDVVGQNETSIAIYYEDKVNHEWIYAGGLLDTANNSVSAPINRFALFTLAPAMPYRSFTFQVSPDTIFADSVSVSVIKSDTIRNNDSTIVENGQLFTIKTSHGSINTQDVDTTVDGLQVSANNGIIEFTLKSSHVSGLANIFAQSVVGSATAIDTVVFIDTLAPEIPLNLSAQEADGKVHLKWLPVNEDDLAGYVIYFDTDTTMPPFEGISTVWGKPSPIFVVADSSYTVLGLFTDILHHFAITAIDISGNESSYSNIVEATSFLDTSNIYQQEICIPLGWSFFSSYIIPSEELFDTVFIDIVSNVELVKNYLGQTFWPIYGINLIGDISICEGYQIKMNLSDTLIVTGLSVQPENTDCNISSGWSYISYLRNSPAPIVDMLSNIVSNIEIVKNYSGQTYWPSYNIDLIGNMNPGEGYQIKMNNATTLTYPANSANISKSNIQNPQPNHFKTTINTGSNMTLGIPKIAWETEPPIDSEIGIYSSEGLLVGSSVFTDENLAISIWGDDELTEEIDGLIENEIFVIKIWNDNSETF